MADSKDICTVLITSCDAFEDCWRPYAYSLHKYWPDCPYRVRIITNEKTFQDAIIEPLPIRPDQGWARNMRAALNAIGTPVVLYTHEDFWLSAKVNTAAIRDYVSLVANGTADYIRLFPAPAPDRPLAGDGRLGVLSVQSPYRTSLQAAIWNREVFGRLLRDEESCWAFELDGTARSRVYGERFLCVWPTIDPKGIRHYEGLRYVCTAVNKGRWSTDALRYAKKEGLKIDFSKRKKESWWDELVRIYPFAWYASRVMKAIGNPRSMIERVIRRWNARVE